MSESNRNKYDLSKNILTNAEEYKLIINKRKEKLFELKNRVTNDDLSAQIARQELKINQKKKEFAREIEKYIDELEDYDIDYRQYIPQNKNFKSKYVYRIAHGVLNDI